MLAIALFNWNSSVFKTLGTVWKLGQDLEAFFSTATAYFLNNWWSSWNNRDRNHSKFPGVCQYPLGIKISQNRPKICGQFGCSKGLKSARKFFAGATKLTMKHLVKNVSFIFFVRNTGPQTLDLPINFRGEMKIWPFVTIVWKIPFRSRNHSLSIDGIIWAGSNFYPTFDFTIWKSFLLWAVAFPSADVHIRGNFPIIFRPWLANIWLKGQGQKSSTTKNRGTFGKNFVNFSIAKQLLQYFLSRLSKIFLLVVCISLVLWTSRGVRVSLAFYCSDSLEDNFNR